MTPQKPGTDEAETQIATQALKTPPAPPPRTSSVLSPVRTLALPPASPLKVSVPELDPCDSVPLVCYDDACAHSQMACANDAGYAKRVATYTPPAPTAPPVGGINPAIVPTGTVTFQIHVDANQPGQVDGPASLPPAAQPLPTDVSWGGGSSWGSGWAAMTDDTAAPDDTAPVDDGAYS